MGKSCFEFLLVNQKHSSKHTEAQPEKQYKRKRQFDYICVTSVFNNFPIEYDFFLTAKYESRKGTHSKISLEFGKCKFFSMSSRTILKPGYRVTLQAYKKMHLMLLHLYCPIIKSKHRY